MVFPDLSVPQTTSFSKNSASKPALASVADRFLAFVLDFLVFSPFIGLLLAGFARQAKIQFLVKGSYDEALGSMILMGAVVVSLSIALQTIFLFYLNATPGQLFAKLRVVSYPGNSSDRADRLSLNQCLVRSILWWASGMALFLPFLEILSHPLRRTFYERASDTLTVTLKTIGDTGPHPIESRFIASWMRMSFLLLLGFALLGGFKAYRSVMAGGSRDGDRKVASASSSCDEKVDLAAYKGAEVLDISLTLYMADAITRRFGATSPILIDVTTEKHYAQPGCSRLKVTFWQDGVLLPGATTPRRQTMDFGINYCLDGRPPQSLK